MSPERPTAPVAPWPTAPPGASGLPVGFPACPVATPHNRRLGDAALIAVVVGVLAIFIAVLAVVALFVEHGPVPRCSPLGCQAPPIGRRVSILGDRASLVVSGGRQYTFASGFAVHVYPLAGTTSQYPSVSRSSSSISLTYPFVASLGGSASLTVSGGPAGGASPEELVQNEVAQIAPNAQLRYVLPGAAIGYWPGYGAAYTTQITSFLGSAKTVEIIVMAVVHGGREVTVTAAGQLIGVGPDSQLYDGHPSPAAISVAYVTGETLNSVTFPGSPIP